MTFSKRKKQILYQNSVIQKSNSENKHKKRNPKLEQLLNTLERKKNSPNEGHFPVFNNSYKQINSNNSIDYQSQSNPQSQQIVNRHDGTLNSSYPPYHHYSPYSPYPPYPYYPMYPPFPFPPYGGYGYGNPNPTSEISDSNPDKIFNNELHNNILQYPSYPHYPHHLQNNIPTNQDLFNSCNSLSNCNSCYNYTNCNPCTPYEP